MTEINPQDETGTMEAPHSPADEHPGPNSSEKHLGLGDSEGCLNTDILGSSDRAEEHFTPGRSEEHPIPDPPGEHPRRDLSEEHSGSNLSKSIEELIRDFENHQKQQLQILRAITHKITNTSQHDAAEPIKSTDAQQTIEVSRDIRDIRENLIQNWNNNRSRLCFAHSFNDLLSTLLNSSETKELRRRIRMCARQLPSEPREPLNGRSPNFLTRQRRPIDNDLETIQYRLDYFGQISNQNDRDFTPDLEEGNPMCAQIIHNLTEYRGLSARHILQINARFHDSTAWGPNQDNQPNQVDQPNLSSHMIKFILGYAMEWKVFRSTNARTGFFSTLQFNIRFFEIPLDDQKLDIDRIQRHPGYPPESELLREVGWIPLPKGTGSIIAERRASVFMAYERRRDPARWTILNFSGRNSPRLRDEGAQDTGRNFLDGVSHFRAWYNLLDMELQNCLLAWHKLLSEMDVGIGLTIDELCDPRSLGELMRDGNDSKRSEFYFVSFSMLRKFADCIEETIEDLQNCCKEVNGRLEEDGASAEGKRKVQEISRQLLKTHREQSQDLLRQIKRKIDMIMPLQESLFNSTSIREASEATHQGRYIFVFTIMTIVYLPLGFVTSLFGMNNITETSPLTTSMAPFAVTFSVIAAVTYIIASGSFPFANRTQFRPMLGSVGKSFRLLLEKRREKRREKRMERVFLEYRRMRSRSRRHALKRLFSFFQKRLSQSAEESTDVENGRNPAAVPSAPTQTGENATPRMTEIELDDMDSNRGEPMRPASVPDLTIEQRL